MLPKQNFDANPITQLGFDPKSHRLQNNFVHSFKSRVRVMFRIWTCVISSSLRMIEFSNLRFLIIS